MENQRRFGTLILYNWRIFNNMRMHGMDKLKIKRHSVSTWVLTITGHHSVFARKEWGSSLTLTLLTWTIWRAPTNASKWRMGFNSAFKGLTSSDKPFSVHVSPKNYEPLVCLFGVEGLKQFINILSQVVQSSAEIHNSKCSAKRSVSWLLRP